MPSILDSCGGAKTLRAFLDGPETADPAPASQAADTAAHLLSGCTPCRRHLEASLAQAGVPARITKALRALGPEHPHFLRLWFADRPRRAQPPPELARGEDGAASPSRAAYLKAAKEYAESLVVQELSETEHLEKAHNLLTHAMVSHPVGLDRHEWQHLIRHAAVAALEAAFRVRDKVAADRYESLLSVFLQYDHGHAYADTEISLAILDLWRKGRLEEVSGPLEELDESDDVSPWATAWRTSLLHLLTGNPLAVVPLLAKFAEATSSPSKAAERRFLALQVLLKANLVDFSEGSLLRKAG